jgi:hypothetical protein
MKVYQITRVALTLASLARLGAAALAQEDDGVERSLELINGLGIEFGPADREAILSFAEQMGIDTPVRVDDDFILPLSNIFVTVVSQVTVDGNHRTWRELRVDLLDSSGWGDP